jgi:hypothetical protein
MLLLYKDQNLMLFSKKTKTYTILRIIQRHAIQSMGRMLGVLVLKHVVNTIATLL